MDLNILAFAIPFFLGFMVLEYWIAMRQGKQYFVLPNVITNINVGIVERLSEVFVAGLFYFIYDYLHRKYAILDIKPTLWSWLALLLCTDFIWYWYHRFAHEVNVLWGVHIVHHQSDDFNYTVSARITVFQALVRTGFWSFLPILGFPAAMITGILLVHGCYPFFVHTQTIGKLGWLEYLFVTPSHHRVHHASNPQYLDKNFGDVLIVWDKLFGTFVEEQEKPVYGLTKPLNSHSFLWQHFHFWLELYIAFQRARGFGAKWQVLFGRPENLDSGIRPLLERRFRINQNTMPVSNALNHYVVWQVLATLFALFFLLLFEHEVSWALKTFFACLILITVINVGAILEQRKWVFHLEYIRIFVVLAAFLLNYPSPFISVPIILFWLFSLHYYNKWEEQYLQFVYNRT